MIMYNIVLRKTYLKLNLNQASLVQICPLRERGILRGKPLGCPLKV